MASKNTELKREQDQLEIKAYLEEIKKIDEKHKLALQPMIKHLQDGSIVPRVQIVRLPEEIKVKKNANKNI